MIEFMALNVYARDFAKNLKLPQKRMLIIEYSNLNKTPPEIRNLIKSKILFKQSPVRVLYVKCGITDLNDMIDNFLHILYLYVNYEIESN